MKLKEFIKKSFRTLQFYEKNIFFKYDWNHK
jgi:hypothetical protein